jgi:hypothetical protein
MYVLSMEVSLQCCNMAVTRMCAEDSAGVLYLIRLFLQSHRPYGSSLRLNQLV